MQEPFRRSNWVQRIAIVVLAASILTTLLFGLRTYNSYLLLRSAYTAGMPTTSAIRPWMTLHYVATRYRVSTADLVARLRLPPETAPDTTLKSIADRSGLSPFDFVGQTQLAVADVAPPAPSRQQDEKSDWLDRIGDELLSALLIYGYPAMALILLFGAIGLPVPTGLSVTLAGSLAALGRMDWLLAMVIAVGASVLGDLVAYALGRLLGQQFLEHHGHWFGYTARRHIRVQSLFEQWGAWTILVTRTLASHLSSVLSLLAGLARYRLSVFLAFDTVGRAIWTSAYFGLGYLIGGNLEAAAGFLANLSGLLVSLTLLIAAAMAASGKFNRAWIHAPD
jgi:membrane protein DedA with SNARE-associated domain